MVLDDEKQALIRELSSSFSIVLLFSSKGGFDVGGNAVVIAPNIAITPMHVISNNKFGSFSGVDLSTEGEYYYPDDSLNILMYSDKYKTRYLLNVDRVFPVKDADLAILYLSPQASDIPDDIWNDIVLHITPPAIDSHVFSIGSRIEDADFGVQDGVLGVRPRYVASFGSVVQFMLKHPQSGPGFYAELTAFNTVSGSPVFDKDKRLVGLVSRAYEGEPLAFVSILFPIFTNRFKHKETVSSHLYDMAKNGTIDCRDLDILNVEGSTASLILPESLRK